MATTIVIRELVLAKAHSMPAFPRVISDILATTDDPEANLNVLTDLVKFDPVLAGRVLFQANTALSRLRHRYVVQNIYNAIMLIGIGKVRQMTLISSWSDFVRKVAPGNHVAMFWQHSAAVGICGEELATEVEAQVSSSAALVAGLMHDVGQLWLFRSYPDAFQDAWNASLDHAEGIEVTEKKHFGACHGEIGAWLAEYWSLPSQIVAAIRHHHDCDNVLDEGIVPLIHVAEVLSNALDLTGRKENRVTKISSAACQRLGIVWNDASRPLFGRIDARSRHINAFLS